MPGDFDVLQTIPLPLGESRQFCPGAGCSNRKRTHAHERTLAVNNHGDRVTYHCWHCDEKGAVRRMNLSEKSMHFSNKKPSPAPSAKPVNRDELRPLSEAAIAYLEGRGISREVALWAGCMSADVRGVEGIAYRYDGGSGFKVKSLTRDENGRRLIRIVGCISALYLQDRIGDYGALDLGAGDELRDSVLPEDLEYDSLSDISKSKQGEPLKGSPSIRSDSFAKDSHTLSDISKSILRDNLETGAPTRAREEAIIICEGEDDALSCVQAGLRNVTSVPHGAINAGSAPRSDDAKLAFVSSQPDFWRPFKRITIAVDADGNGRALMDGLARRLDRWRCFVVTWPDGCKDANDVLTKHGAWTLADIVGSAEATEMPGLYEADAFYADVDRLRRGELGKGESVGFPSLDPFFRVAPGVTLVTGWPKHGKSDFVDQCGINLAERLGWRTVLFSRENPPPIHIAKLAEKFARQRFFPDMPNLMDEQALERAKRLVREHFKFVRLSSGNTIEAILERFSAAVARFGCRNGVIDPYNAIQRPMGCREDEFIVDMLNKTIDWTEQHEAHVFFVAHPKGTAPENGRPKRVDGNHVSGGPTWWAKCNFGLTIERFDHETKAHVWAARHAHLGQNGTAPLQYNFRTASFEDGDKFSVAAPSTSLGRQRPALVVDNTDGFDD